MSPLRARALLNLGGQVKLELHARQTPTEPIVLEGRTKQRISNASTVAPVQTRLSHSHGPLHALTSARQPLKRFSDARSSLCSFLTLACRSSFALASRQLASDSFSSVLCEPVLRRGSLQKETGTDEVAAP